MTTQIKFIKKNGRSFGINRELDKFFISTPISPPTAPSNLTLTVATVSGIALSWTDNSSDETGFEIEYSTNGSSWNSLTTKAAGATSHNDWGLSANTLRYYRIRATKNGVTSAWTDAIAARTFIRLFTVGGFNGEVSPDAFTTNEDTSVTINAPGFLTNDFTNLINLSGLKIGNPIYGTLTSFNEATGAFVYEPGIDFFGIDYIYYQGRDDGGYSAPIKITMQVLEQPG